MEIHKFEKFWIWLSVILIFGYIGTVVYGGLGAGIAMVSEEGGTIETPTNPVKSPNFRSPGLYRNEDGTYSVYLLAEQFLFRPGTGTPLKVPAGKKVTFYLTSGDVIHGFHLVGTNVNVMAIPGQIAKFTVKFDKTNSYGLICHEYCGAGHHLMEGKVNVVNSDQIETK